MASRAEVLAPSESRIRIPVLSGNQPIQRAQHSYRRPESLRGSGLRAAPAAPGSVSRRHAAGDATAALPCLAPAAIGEPVVPRRRGRMFVRQLHSVAAVLLGLVERPVGGRDQTHDVGARLAARHADAHGRGHRLIGDRHSRRPRTQHGRARPQPPHPRRARQDGDELFAAEAAKHVGRPHVDARDRWRTGAAPSSPSGVAEAIVDLLEVIEIEHQHADRLAFVFEPLDQQRGRRHEAAPVQHAGQLVGRRPHPCGCGPSAPSTAPAR